MNLLIIRAGRQQCFCIPSMNSVKLKSLRMQGKLFSQPPPGNSVGCTSSGPGILQQRSSEGRWMGQPAEPFWGPRPGHGGENCQKPEELNMERVVIVKVGRQLKLLSFHLRLTVGWACLVWGVRRHWKGFGPTSSVCRVLMELSLTAGGCLNDACPALVLLRKHCCPIQTGGLILPFSGQWWWRAGSVPWDSWGGQRQCFQSICLQVTGMDRRSWSEC